VALMLGVDVYAHIPLYNGESFFDLEGHIHDMYVEVAKKIEQRLKLSQIVK
jgi:hypothetical protein